MVVVAYGQPFFSSSSCLGTEATWCLRGTSAVAEYDLTMPRIFVIISVDRERAWPKAGSIGLPVSLPSAVIKRLGPPPPP